MNILFLRTEQMIGLATVFVLRPQRVTTIFGQLKTNIGQTFISLIVFFGRSMFHCNAQLRKQE